MELSNYGVNNIRVIDNGKGISKDNFEFLSKRYCTSKINSFENLEELTSYGFRGEALHSCASFSNLMIITRTMEDEEATKLLFDNDGSIIK